MCGYDYSTTFPRVKRTQSRLYTKRHYHRYSERYDKIRYSIDLFVGWHMTYNTIVLLHYSDFRNRFKYNCTRVIVTLACPISTWAWVTIKINIFCQNNYLDIHCLHNIKHKTPWRFSYLSCIHIQDAAIIILIILP